MNATPSLHADAWAAIEKERQRDRRLRRLSAAAWTATFLVVLVYAAITAANVADAMRLVAVGAAMQGVVYQAAMPLVVVVGILSVLIATLTTVGVFLRLRTASLTEIQLRLAALEEMLVRRGSDE
jgi:cytochrome bd-type quinol oxidase subunit 2